MEDDCLDAVTAVQAIIGSMRNGIHAETSLVHSHTSTFDTAFASDCRRPMVSRHTSRLFLSTLSYLELIGFEHG